MKTNTICMLTIITIFLYSCTYPYDNPADQDGSEYQGYLVYDEDSIPDDAALSLTVVFPETEESIFDTTPLFDWNDVANAEGYQIQIAATEDDLSETDPIIVTISEYQISVGDRYEFGTAHFWRVRIMNGENLFSAWSRVYCFHVSGDIDWSGISPADQASTRDTTPILDWDDVNGASGYEVEFATSEDDLDGTDIKEVTSSEYEVAPDEVLAYNDTCYWRVRALNEDEVAGTWSAVNHFNIIWDITWTGITPSDGGGTLDPTPLLDWDDVDGAASYEVEFATGEDALDGTDIWETEEAEYEIPSAEGFADGENCFWRIRGINEDGVSGGWSEVFSFGISGPLIDLVPVTGGTFDMGSFDGYTDEQPVHSVTVSDFFIGRYEITQGAYEDMMGSNPSYNNGVGDDYPVYYITWYNAIDFCNALSDLEGLEPCYSQVGTYWSCDFSKNGYRLPTEAEWEYIARGGNASSGWIYAGSDTLGDVAWYMENSGDSSHPVGTKEANELGIYDINGNLSEWCGDWWDDDYYEISPSVDPTGPSSTTYAYKVLRGGAWNSSDDTCRVACRDKLQPHYTGSVGFRVVRKK